MQQEDLEACMDFRQLRGWNQTKADWDLFLTQHPDLLWWPRLEENTSGVR